MHLDFFLEGAGNNFSKQKWFRKGFIKLIFTLIAFVWISKANATDDFDFNVSSNLIFDGLISNILKSDAYSNQSTVGFNGDINDSYYATLHGQTSMDVDNSLKYFSLHASEGQKINFQIYTLKNPNNLNQIKPTLINPGSVIVSCSKSSTEKHNTFYGVIPKNTALYPGAYTCHLIFKAYLDK